MPRGPGRLKVGAKAAEHAALAVLAGLGMVASVAALLSPGFLPMDGASATFLLAASLAATAEPARTAPLTLAAVAGSVLSPGLFGLVLGFGLACALSARPVFGIVPLLAAVALLGGDSFAGVRLHPAGTVASVAVLALSFVGAAPLLAGRTPPLAVAGLYVLARTLELCGPGAPGWWGLVLMPAGAALAVVGAWSAVAADTVPAVGQRLFTAGLGLAVTALGAEAAARGSDLTELAAAAAAGFATLTVATAAGLAAGALAGRAVEAGAGTVRLSHLGGLAGAMPRASACLLAACASLAFLPPSWGFAGVWLTGQAVLGLPRSGTAGIVTAISGAAAGLALGCAVAAVLRLLLVACLGRPRTPRTSAATDARGWRGMVPMVAALLLVAAGLAAGPAAGVLAGGAVPRPAFWLTPGLFVFLAAVAAPAVVLARPRRRTEAWNDGRDAPPPWLPFGDPAEQWGAASFAAPFRLPALRWRWPLRSHAAAPALLFAVLLLAAFLAVRL